MKTNSFRALCASLAQGSARLVEKKDICGGLPRPGGRGRRNPKGAETHMATITSRSWCSLVLRYCGIAYGGAWALWVVAAFLGGQGSAGFTGSLAGAFLVMGTLMPLIATYALFPRLCACGLAVSPNPRGREGFGSYAFALHPTVRGWVAFLLLLVWRWAMFYGAFGFPTPGAVGENLLASWPLLLLGGGLEEVGWRGCLQPALERWWSVGKSGFRRLAGIWGAPLVTGCIWGLWHGPLMLVPGTFQSQVPLWAIVLVGVALSFSFGALRRVAANLDACILSHAWYNAMLVAVPTFGPVACILFLVEAVGGAVVLGAPWYSDVSKR